MRTSDFSSNVNAYKFEAVLGNLKDMSCREGPAGLIYPSTSTRRQILWEQIVTTIVVTSSLSKIEETQMSRNVPPDSAIPSAIPSRPARPSAPPLPPPSSPARPYTPPSARSSQPSRYTHFKTPSVSSAQNRVFASQITHLRYVHPATVT